MIAKGVWLKSPAALLITMCCIVLSTKTHANYCGLYSGSPAVSADQQISVCITEFAQDCGGGITWAQPLQWCDANYNSNDAAAGQTICTINNNYTHFVIWRTQKPVDKGCCGLNADLVVCSNSPQSCSGHQTYGCWTEPN